MVVFKEVDSGLAIRWRADFTQWPLKVLHQKITNGHKQQFFVYWLCSHGPMIALLSIHLTVFNIRLATLRRCCEAIKFENDITTFDPIVGLTQPPFSYDPARPKTPCDPLLLGPVVTFVFAGEASAQKNKHKFQMPQLKYCWSGRQAAIFSSLVLFHTALPLSCPHWSP